MARAVFGLGGFLVLLGLTFISMGVPIVRLEIGWTEIIGGSVAASAGCIVLVLGVFLTRLDAMQTVLERLAPPVVVDADEPTLVEIADPAPVDPPGFRARHPLAPWTEPADPEIEPVRPEPALSASLHPEPVEEPAPPIEAAEVPMLSEGAPALVTAEAGPDKAEAAAPPLPAPVVGSGRDRPGFLSSILARRGIGLDRRGRDLAPTPSFSVIAPPEESRAPPLTPIDLSSGWEAHEPPVVASHDPLPVRDPGHVEPAPVPEAVLHPGPEEGGVHAPEHVPAAAVPDPEPAEAVAAEPPPAPEPEEASVLQPVVVGRYNAGSASYVMYSNGMIEVETEQGTHQFASMQELKAFIERRDAPVS